MPSLSDYVYPVLMDVDPEQLVDDEFKNYHNQVFCWRMLKLISQVDLTTFSGHHKPSNAPGASSTTVTQQASATNGAAEHGAASRAHHQQFEVFEGNIEEQARILCKQFMKREILDHLPEQKDEGSDGEEENDNAASMEVDDLAGGEPAAVPVENGNANVGPAGEEKGADRQTASASSTNANAAASNGQKSSAGLEVIKASQLSQPSQQSKKDKEHLEIEKKTAVESNKEDQ